MRSSAKRTGTSRRKSRSPAGTRYYKFDNTIYRLHGFGPDNPAVRTWRYNRCLTPAGKELRDPDRSHDPLISGRRRRHALHQRWRGRERQAASPSEARATAGIHRFNAQWKPTRRNHVLRDLVEGLPAGRHQPPAAGPRLRAGLPDQLRSGLENDLLGSRLRWNGAIYHQKWEGIQFSYLGANSLTVTQNGRDAKVNGIETDINYVAAGSDFDRRRRLHPRQDQREHLPGGDRRSDAELHRIAWTIGTPTSDDERDFILVPSGTRLPITPKFKASATARYTWPMWPGNAHVQGAIAYQGSAPSDDSSRARTQVTRQDPGLHPGRPVRRLRLGQIQRSSCSPRTSSTTATNCRASSVCGSLHPGARSIPAVRGRSALAHGAKF